MDEITVEKYKRWVEANDHLSRASADLQGLFTVPSERESLVDIFNFWAREVERLTDELEEVNAFDELPIEKGEPW